MDDKSFSRKVVSEAETGEQLLWLLCLQVYQGGLPKNSYRETQKYVKNTLYIHLIIIIDCVTMSLYIYIHILIYFPLIQTCRPDGWRKRSYGKIKSKQFKSL